MITTLRMKLFWPKMGGSRLFGKNPGMSTGESGTPTPGTIIKSSTHFRMEVGGDLHRFHNKVIEK